MISEACVIYMIEIHSPIETNTITQKQVLYLQLSEQTPGMFHF